MEANGKVVRKDNLSSCNSIFCPAGGAYRNRPDRKRSDQGEQLMFGKYPNKSPVFCPSIKRGLCFLTDGQGHDDAPRIGLFFERWRKQQRLPGSLVGLFGLLATISDARRSQKPARLWPFWHDDNLLFGSVCFLFT